MMMRISSMSRSQSKDNMKFSRDTSSRHKFEQNRAAVNNNLVTTFGLDAQNWESESHWDIDWEGRSGEESEEEDTHFKSYNLEREVARAAVHFRELRR